MLEPIISVMISGIIYGSVYTLVSMGYTLAYGVGKILNLAHGAFYLITGYMLYFFWRTLMLPTIISIILPLIIVTSIGILAYFLLIKPMEENEISVLIGTFALGFFIEQFIIVIWGGGSLYLFDFFSSQRVDILGNDIPWQSILLIIATIVIVIVISLFIKYSKTGKSIRAVSQDREAAMLSGINADRVVLITFVISAFLVGIAAILHFPGGSLASHLGWPTLTNAFAVVILGGLGSIKGSVLAAYILGISRSVVAAFIGWEFTGLIPIIVVFIVLIIRPRGLFGKKEVK